MFTGTCVSEKTSFDIGTVEPPNKGRIWTRNFVLFREVFFIQRLKCTGIIGIGTSRFVLYREVLFIRSVLYRKFHCIYISLLLCRYLEQRSEMQSSVKMC